jgi:ubiquinone/menaquinone biosynthesis C-methylase UbiE
MTLLSLGDFIDVFFYIRQHTASRLLQRLHPVQKKRVENVWQCIDNHSSDWWIVPAVRKRWNRLITGDENKSYQEFFCNTYLSSEKSHSLLSIGSGGGTNEILFSRQNCFSEITGIDISKKIIEHAEEKLVKQKINNIQFIHADAEKFHFEENKYDVVLFHSSLHHFNHLGKILDRILNALKPSGFLIIHEYTGPNRFQWSKKQLQLANDILKNLPAELKTLYHNNYHKSKIYKPGLLRTFISDPSEATCSANLLKEINSRFIPIQQTNLGGNLLHLLLKDIAHNFVDEQMDTKQLIEALFKKEDELVQAEGHSDFTFGIYRKNNH